jgi:membrane protein implicated in regulation of membrane protease activity
MPASLHQSRAQEKLDIVLGQVTSLRSRLNWLALQHGLYLVLAIGITLAAVLFAGAMLLSPLQFLGAAGAMALLGLAALWTTLRSALRRRSNAQRAAALADERAGLKGRLTTIVQTVSSRRRGALWAYLVEDALAHRDEFLPARVERRRIARAWWTPLAALAVAALLIPMARTRQNLKIAANLGTPDITVDLDDLHLRPAEPGDSNGLQVQADPATMERLREKLAREGVTAGQGDSGKLGGLLDRARNLAGDVQSKLRGDSKQQQRLTLRLADNEAGLDPSDRRGSDTRRNSHRGEQAGQFKRDNPGEDEPALPSIDDALREPDAQGNTGDNGDNGQDSGSKGKPLSAGNDSSQSAQTDEQRGEQSYNGGAVHGIGADPDSLFGEPSKSKMSAEGFEIAIEARPVEQGAKGAGQAYLPPKVHTPLNTHQQPDEPIPRAAVPPDDRITIQRVFER